MKLTIEPTEEFFMLGDVMVRMWQGQADDGSPVVALVTAVASTGQVHEFAAGLVPIPPPSPDDAQRWARTILEGSADMGEAWPDPRNPSHGEIAGMPSPEQMRSWAQAVLADMPGPPGFGERRPWPDPHLLRMTYDPEGWGPYDRWKLTVHDTGLVLASGAWPIDEALVHAVSRAYSQAIDELTGEGGPSQSRSDRPT